MSTWIPISERLPTREETNGHDNVWAVDERGTHWIWDYVMMPISRFARPPIAWHPYPRYTPPKPGPTDEECKSLWNVTAPLEGGTEVPIMRDYVPDRMRRWFADVTARIEREKGK